MKIAIDISQIVYGTGVSTYTKNLVENLLDIDDKNDYKLFGFAFRKKQELKSYLNSITEDIDHKIIGIPPTLSEILFNKFPRLSIDKFLGRTNVLHTSDWVEPKSKAFKITTVHDLIPVLFPELSNEKLVIVHKRKIDLVKKESDIVIVPSNTTKQDLMRLGVGSSRIRVIPEATDSVFRPQNDKKIKSIRNKYKLKKEYILSVGITKRKNTQNLIDAFQKLELKNIELVLVGHPYVEINFTKGVRLLGHVDKDDLPALYSGALVFAYPSLYEGFGLPILESFACETPVVTSDLGSMREVAEGAAVLIDPREVDQIADGILKAIKEINKLIALGRKKAKDYNWQNTAKMTLNVYEESEK